ncbi:MAG: arylesterase [Tunicatimonas sp.]
MLPRKSMFLFFLIGLLGIACQSPNQPAEEAQPVETVMVAADDTASSEKIILFFGNSLTAGYGLEPSEAFPALIQQKLDSLGYDYRTVNAGLSGETTASGLSRLDWVLERQPVDIFVLELGANDGLRGIEPTETQRNLAAIIDQVRAANPQVAIVLAGMLVPPNMGNAYTERFQQVFPAVAEAKDVTLIPFLLEGVAGDPELNQADGIHPTAPGQKIVTENVWTALKPLLEADS